MFQCLPLICLECNQFPQIQINSLSALTTRCSCGNEENISIEHYLRQLRKREQNNYQDNNKCRLHHNYFEYYCIECAINCCQKCQKIHNKHHKIIDLTIPICTTMIQNELQKNFENITKSMLLSKKQEINYYIGKINKIEYQYQQKIKQIKSYSLLIQSLIDTYTQYKYNFNCIKNINKLLF